MAEKKEAIVSIDQQKIFVLDNFISKSKNQNLVSQIALRKFGRYLTTSHPQRKGYTWMLNLKTDQPSKIVNEVKAAIQKRFRYEELYLCRMYVHSLSFGDISLPHKDCKTGVDDVTAVLYLNTAWDVQWGGEIMFYRGKEADRAVSIKPARLILFPGEITHSANPPNLLAPEPRLSWVFKFTRSKKMKALFDRDLAKFDELFDLMKDI